MILQVHSTPKSIHGDLSLKSTFWNQNFKLIADILNENLILQVPPHQNIQNLIAQVPQHQNALSKVFNSVWPNKHPSLEIDATPFWKRNIK